MNRPHRCALLPPIVTLSLALGAAAQGADKPAEWPPLKDADKQRVLALAGQFQKPEVKLYEEARRGLVAIGAGAAPLLFQQIKDRADHPANAQVFLVLDAVLAPEHAALMAIETKKPRPELRRYLALRLCRFADATLVPFWKSLRKDPDALTAFYAELALLAQQERDAIAPVLAFAKTRWSEIGPLVAEVLPAARGNALAAAVFEAIRGAPAADQMTGLRLLRHLMVPEQNVILRNYLDASDHTVKREAVNTARVLHGEPPIENLSVFQAIEMAKQWKEKL